MIPSACYGLARKALFALDAEHAHHLTIASLARAPFTGAAFGRAGDDPVEVMGLQFRNRIGLAAGLDKNAECIPAWNAMGFGFAEVGTITPKPQPGNAKPRMFRLPAKTALINRLGFNNVGLDKALSNVRSARRGNMVLGINIGKNAATPAQQAVDDYVTGLMAAWPLADYITVNVSSPNTKGLRDLQAGDARDALLGALSASRVRLQDATGQNVPIAIKIAPDMDDDGVRAMADAAVANGLDAIVATNTTLARDAVQGLSHADEVGGLSGAPVRERATAVVRVLAEHLGGRLPIIGVGGVTQPEHAVEKLQAGASLVQIYTGLIYAGPALVRHAVRAAKQS
ncbi:quinone-dependent dihydroorotate dehydrogenase [bacterium]|nr:quinone-dependent dihydroorotate dehydrogenase [bacterium]